MATNVRIRDVARRAGVSVGTVSNVLNGLATVRPENLERVRRAMAELDFVPNSNARLLRTGRSQAIGLIVLTFGNPHLGELAHTLEEVAEDHGSTLFVGSSDRGVKRATRYLDLFEESRVRGLLVSPVRGLMPRLVELQARGTPTVLFDDSFDIDGFCTVAMDGTAAGRLAARHLIEIGRRRLMVAGGPVYQVGERLHGASQVVEETGGVSLAMVSTSDQTVAEGRTVGRRIAAMPAAERPDAVFAVNDLIGLGVMQELALAGIRIPEEIALVGCDDIDFAQTAIYPMTTLAQPLEAIARTAIDLLLDEERNPLTHVHQRPRPAPELRIRASTVAR